MTGGDAPDVKVENHLFRFSHDTPIDQASMVSRLKATMNGKFAMMQLETPKATILVDEKGRMTVHGANRIEVARAAAKETLLRLGRDDDGLKTELGPILASFQYSRPLSFDGFERAVSPASVIRDERLDCIRLTDDRHDLELMIWQSGKAVVLGASHANIVAMAAVHWRQKLDDAGLFIESVMDD